MGENLVEFYVHTTEVRGRENFFVENYEAPTEIFVDIDTDNKTVEECARTILSYEY